MDAFDDAFGGEGVEVDPAAEFLAKEQEELADLGEDLGFAAPPPQVPYFTLKTLFLLLPPPPPPHHQIWCPLPPLGANINFSSIF